MSALGEHGPLDGSICEKPGRAANRLIQSARRPIAAWAWGRLCAGFAALALIAACSPGGIAQHSRDGASVAGEASAPKEGQRHPISGLALIELRVRSKNGVHRFRTELADTPLAQQRGLMFRTELGDDEAMLFPSSLPEERSFWMKNTPIALDILFIGPDRRILNIAERTEPYSLAPIRSAGPTIAVLELRGGRAGELGIEPGDEVEWELPSPLPAQ